MDEDIRIVWNKSRSSQKRRFKLRRYFEDANRSLIDETLDFPRNSYRKIRDQNSDFFCHVLCECNVTYSLSKKFHTITDKGLIFPSVYHSSCGLHEWIVLLDWNVKTDIMSGEEYCPYCKQRPCVTNCEFEIAEYNNRDNKKRNKKNV